MNNVAVGRSIGNGPGCMIKVFQVVKNFTAERPVLRFVEPASFNPDGRLAVGVHHYVDA